MPYQKIRDRIFGAPRDPLSKETRHKISLAIFLAWVGLGADGLSSSTYGPQEAFIALGEHASLAFYLACATVFTVFVISFAYMQVIELFPNGGGGYQVATRLISPKAGLISGSALIVDYVLTIAISIASGLDAVFSPLPNTYLDYKIPAAILLIMSMTYLNLRGTKESIKILLPIFMGFVITHAFLIIYGIFRHKEGLPQIVPEAIDETFELGSQMGWVFVAALLLKAISLGGGTYTGLEAVSNNVASIAEPRIRNAKLTMFFVALSLAFMAAGIITLYLVWDVRYVEGETLNATVFGLILSEWTLWGLNWKELLLPMVLFFEFGLLFVAANTGFITGPIVLSKMAIDKWMPSSFSSLSSRLVTKNGVLLMGAAAIGVLIATDGKVSTLVILYSINVFVTFTLSFFGLSKYWMRRRRREKKWKKKLAVSGTGFLLTGGILIVTVVEKFGEGGWLTIIITGCVVAIGYIINKSYSRLSKKLNASRKELVTEEHGKHTKLPLQHDKPTAVFILDDNIGSTIYAADWVARNFPDVYKNFVFIGVGEIDSDNFSEDALWEKKKWSVKQNLKKLVNHWQHQGVASASYLAYGTDVVEQVTLLSEKMQDVFKNPIFFTTKLVMQDSNFVTRMLYNETAYIIQRRLHNNGYNLIVIPMTV